MVQASEIRDEATLQAWLEGRPEETRRREAVLMAHRPAMRILSSFVYSAIMEYKSERSAPYAVLSIFRLNLLLSTLMEQTDERIKEACRTASIELSNKKSPHNTIRKEVGSEIYRNGLTAAEDVLLLANLPFDGIPSMTAKILRIVALGAYSAAGEDSDPFGHANSIWLNTKIDAVSLEQGEQPQYQNIWAKGTIVERQQIGIYRNLPEMSQFIDDWPTTRNLLSAENWADFWIRWYEAALEGRPLTGDWENHGKLLTDIALIPDEDWQQGAEHVARLIERIEERYRLLAETRRLEASLAPVVDAISPSPIGHNNPPEGLDDAPPVQSVLIVWDVLNEAEKELEKPKPDKSALRRIAGILLNASIEIAKYCGKLADTALQKAAEEVGTSSGKWAVGLCGGSVAAKMLGVDDLIRNLGEALARYAGG